MVIRFSLPILAETEILMTLCEVDQKKIVSDIISRAYRMLFSPKYKLTSISTKKMKYLEGGLITTTWVNGRKKTA